MLGSRRTLIVFPSSRQGMTIACPVPELVPCASLGRDPGPVSARYSHRTKQNTSIYADIRALLAVGIRFFITVRSRTAAPVTRSNTA